MFIFSGKRFIDKNMIPLHRINLKTNLTAFLLLKRLNTDTKQNGEK